MCPSHYHLYISHQYASRIEINTAASSHSTFIPYQVMQHAGNCCCVQLQGYSQQRIWQRSSLFWMGFYHQLCLSSYLGHFLNTYVLGYDFLCCCISLYQPSIWLSSSIYKLNFAAWIERNTKLYFIPCVNMTSSCSMDHPSQPYLIYKMLHWCDE